MGPSLLPSFSTGKTYHYPGQGLSLINYTPGRGAHRRRQGCVHTRMALSTEHPSSSAQTHSRRKQQDMAWNLSQGSGPWSRGGNTKRKARDAYLWGWGRGVGKGAGFGLEGLERCTCGLCLRILVILRSIFGFFNLGTIDILAQICLRWGGGGCHVHVWPYPRFLHTRCWQRPSRCL